MATGATGALIDAGTKFVGEAVFGKGARKAAKKAAKAQERLFALQAEEQELRNRVLRESIEEQDRNLPYELSRPSLSTASVGQSIRPDGLEVLTATGPSGIPPWALLVAAGAAILFLVRS